MYNFDCSAAIYMIYRLFMWKPGVFSWLQSATLSVAAIKAFTLLLYSYAEESITFWKNIDGTLRAVHFSHSSREALRPSSLSVWPHVRVSLLSWCLFLCQMVFSFTLPICKQAPEEDFSHQARAESPRKEYWGPGEAVILRLQNWT